MDIRRHHSDEHKCSVFLVEHLSKIRPCEVFSTHLEALDLSDCLFDYNAYCVRSVKAADVMDEGR
jgi:hypothetical protein